MYSDLFEHLGGGGAMGGRGGGAAAAPTNAAAPQDKPIVSLKAGKMNLVPNVDRGTYSCTADTSRGEIRLVCVSNALEWQWYDRRQKKVVDRRVVPNSTTNVMSDDDDSPTTARWQLEKISSLPTTTHKEDRVYVLTHNSSKHDVYDMYWMQDADESKEEEMVAEFNKYLSDPEEAVAQHGDASAAAGNGGASASRNAVGAGGASSSQVDALSSILENLGMPQSTAGAASSSSGTNTLTLADLQGAMAGIQQQQASSSSATAVMSLADVVTPDAISALLQDEDVCSRLLELLPEEQRSRELLEDNLRSPQVQQTLRALTSALLPDDAGHVDGFLSVIANFQLGSANPETIRAASSNPIQAFLDAILNSVENEEGEGEESKEE